MTGGKVMVVGLRNRDWPDLRSLSNRLVFVGSDPADLAKAQRAGIPAGVEAIVLTRFMSHGFTGWLRDAVGTGVRVFPPSGTGEARVLVLRLLQGIRQREAEVSKVAKALVAQAVPMAARDTTGAGWHIEMSAGMPPAAKEAVMATGNGPTLGEFLPGVGRAKSALRLWVEAHVDGHGTLTEEAVRLVQLAVKEKAVESGYTVSSMLNMVRRARIATGLGTVAGKPAAEHPVTPPKVQPKLGVRLRSIASELTRIAKEIDGVEELSKDIARLRKALK